MNSVEEYKKAVKWNKEMHRLDSQIGPSNNVSLNDIIIAILVIIFFVYLVVSAIT